MARKKKVGRQFYLLPLIILAVTVALSVLPLFTDAESRSSHGPKGERR